MGKLLGRKREEDQPWQREFAEEIAALDRETEALRKSTERLAALQEAARRTPRGRRTAGR